MTSTHQSNLALLSVLSQPSGKRPALPHELILEILQYPPCWVLLSREILPASVTISSHIGTTVLCSSPPFTASSLRRFGKAVFSFRSHDQGWCSSPDSGSWTWFDVRVVSNKKTPRPNESIRQAWERQVLLQRNRQAEWEPMSYVHTLGPSEGILSDLQVGDEIQLLGCARFPGWSNSVEEAAIEIWGIDTLGEEQYLDEQILSPEPTSEIQHTTRVMANYLGGFLGRFKTGQPSRRRNTPGGKQKETFQKVKEGSF